MLAMTHNRQNNNKDSTLLNHTPMINSDRFELHDECIVSCMTKFKVKLEVHHYKYSRPTGIYWFTDLCCFFRQSIRAFYKNSCTETNDFF